MLSKAWRKPRNKYNLIKLAWETDNQLGEAYEEN